MVTGSSSARHKGWEDGASSYRYLAPHNRGLTLALRADSVRAVAVMTVRGILCPPAPRTSAFEYTPRMRLQTVSPDKAPESKQAIAEPVSVQARTHIDRPTHTGTHENYYNAAMKERRENRRNAKKPFLSYVAPIQGGSHQSSIQGTRADEQ